MGLFTKKKPPIEQVEKECGHKFQDFPWFLTWDLDCGRYIIKVIESYVCIYCGQRENKVLACYTGTGYQEGKKLLESLSSRFKDHIKSQEEVEDMINDMILVDPEHLKWYHLLRDQQDPSTSRPQVEFNNKPELKL